MIFQSPWPDIAPAVGSICDAVLGPANNRGSKNAVIEGETGRTLTYQDLVHGVERVAAGLTRAGVRPGEPVAVTLPTSIDFVLAWYGALRAGAWVVPINPLYTRAEMDHQIRDSGARYVVGAGEINDLSQCIDSPPVVAVTPQDMAVLPYSSGTTGLPKGVMLTHGNIVDNMNQLRMTGEFHPDDVIVNMMPLYHVAGLNYLLNPMLDVGATLVLMQRFDLETWLKLNEQYRATFLIAPPPVVLAVTKSPLWDKFRLDSVRQAACGAAPLGADGQAAFEQRTGLLLRQGWGMTEGSGIISMTFNDRAKRKLGSCGHLLPSSQARVVDIASGNDLGTSETGEIWLRGPNVTRGYWQAPAANADTFMDGGWMRTGDIGYFDADGHVYLVDRAKELIKYNALQVAPAELEDIVQSHPAVLDAAVIGAPDESAGEIPMAFVVRRPGASLDAAELMQYVAERVAPYKKIRAVEFVDQIPKSPTGKILRRVLKKTLDAKTM